MTITAGAADDRSGAAIILAPAALIVLLFALSLAIGPVTLSPAALARGLAGTADIATTLIVREIRLPRAVLALLVGAALGASGAALQGLLRNPLADPGTIGVTATAGLGAVLAFYFGVAALSPLILPVGGMLGALIGATLLYRLAGRDPSILTLVIAGVAMSTLANALISLALNLSPSPFAAAEIVFWLLGSVSDRSMLQVWLAGPPILAGLALLLSTGRALDALSLGEDAATSLGFPIRATELRVIAGTTLAVGAATAIAGGIGFVGLVTPHLVRPFTRQRPGRAVLPSALAGAALLLAADILVRLSPTAQEIKLGVVTALVGAPFFVVLVLRRRGGDRLG